MVMALASVEPAFDPELDALWKLDLVDGRGDGSRWLEADVATVIRASAVLLRREYPPGPEGVVVGQDAAQLGVDRFGGREIQRQGHMNVAHEGFGGFDGLPVARRRVAGVLPTGCWCRCRCLPRGLTVSLPVSWPWFDGALPVQLPAR